MVPASKTSKSESNRVLIIQALSPKKIYLKNLALARDTQTMIRLLQDNSLVLDVLDAGTTMRFLTAYYTIINHEKILTGSQRMQERPIGILVDALEHLGGTINYLKNKKYPPIHILNFEQKNDEVALKANISSQYISALLMVAPVLPKGLKINILSEIYSKPYIDMTLALMAYFGIDYRWENQLLV